MMTHSSGAFIHLFIFIQICRNIFLVLLLLTKLPPNSECFSKVFPLVSFVIELCITCHMPLLVVVVVAAVHSVLFGFVRNQN